ncbi:uncharacterized protein LOC119079487 [Bradysia coprophila]|uniref:uncharacterized protein LOC119079487 n=1 Tax=Bradysia coprophila TaxID=38358 RepID=UPI00187DA955|nr:uncharacterized protein LOC119079487 [Bradysia coprophila]
MEMETFETPFPYGLIQADYGVIVFPNSYSEWDIIRISISIREEANWAEKMNDPTVVARWKDEIASPMSQSERKFEYVLAELGHYLSIRDGSIEVAAVDGTWQSDALIDDALRNEFMGRVSILENIPDSKKDWCPGSNNQVLDLINPSLFCFVAGRSRVTLEPMPPFCDEKLLQFADDDKFMSLDDGSKFALKPTASLPTSSAKFQWLPAEFHVDESGEVKITSYINNLHPECHPTLYRCIEKIFEKFVPMFNKVLTDLRNPRKNRIKTDFYENFDFGVEREGQDATQPIKIHSFESPPPPKKIVKLNGRDLQVIVKLANIHLTPDRPEYPGGSWHVEGMANERIVASGVYYYSSNNITESRLNFRHAVQDNYYDRNDHGRVFQGQYQVIGSIITKEGRCIAFPNTLQHQVTPFKLEDPTRDGHRKFLVFYLVDPSVKILSTSQVPPQQKAWYKLRIESKKVDFPIELVRRIVDYMEWPMSLVEAKRHRDELINERNEFAKKPIQEYFARPYYQPDP